MQWTLAQFFNEKECCSAETVCVLLGCLKGISEAVEERYKETLL